MASDEFYDVLLVQAPGVELWEGQEVEYSRQIQSGPHGPRLLATDVRIVDESEPSA